MGSPWGARVTLSVDSTPTFARRLKQARLHTGLSQKELGIRAGLDPHVASPRINQYERGKHEPKLETAERLAQALGIPAALLYFLAVLLEVAHRVGDHAHWPRPRRIQASPTRPWRAASNDCSAVC